MLKKVIIITILAKICIFLFIIAGFYLFPFNTTQYEKNFRYPENEPISLVSAFKTWDSQHYLYLSHVWYSPGQPSNAFYPLYPFLIRLLTPVFQNSLITGLFISNILSLIGIIYFYLFVKDYFKKNTKIAFTSIIMLLIFPTAFYFSLIYTESLAFFLTVAFFYYLYKNNFWLAGIFAFLLPLARPVGIFILVPFLVYFFSFNFAHSVNSAKIKRLNISFDKKFLLILSPLIGFIVYFLIIFHATSSFTSSFDAHKYYTRHKHVSNITRPEIFLNNLFAPIPPYHGGEKSGVDRAFYLLFIFTLYFIYKKLDKTLFAYSCTIVLVSFFGGFLSYPRFLLLAFPVFMVLALYFNSIKNPLLRYLIIYLLIVIELTFLITHTQANWVA